MKKMIVMAGILLALTPLVFLGCGTMPGSVRMGDLNTFKTVTEKGVAVSFQYYDRTALVTQYTRKNNPFAYSPAGAAILVHVATDSEDLVGVRVQEAELSSMGGTLKPIPKDELYSYWYDRITWKNKRPSGDSTGRLQSWSYTTTKRIESDMLPDTVEVSPQEQAEGFIIFEGSLDAADTVTMALPVYVGDGETPHIFSYRFQIGS
jgi:hypothetical protein